MTKYHAKPVVIDDIRFASQAEGRRYKYLKEQEEKGAIQELILQPKYYFWHDNKKVCGYIADFSYIDIAADALVVEDVKGVLTPMYRLKKKMLKIWYGIEVQEVK